MLLATDLPTKLNVITSSSAQRSTVFLCFLILLRQRSLELAYTSGNKVLPSLAHCIRCYFTLLGLELWGFEGIIRITFNNIFSFEGRCGLNFIYIEFLKSILNFFCSCNRYLLKYFEGCEEKTQYSSLY